MAIIVYRSTDASAPTLTGQAGSLISLLDACLVNGYGSKPAAGWTKAFSGTNLAAYRMTTASPATGSYLRIDDTGTTSARVVGYETMTDVNTGTNPFPTTVQLSGGGYIYKSITSDSTSRPWCLIADNTNARSFYLMTDVDQTVFGSVVNWSTQYFFGDIISRKAVDGYQCMLICQAAIPNNNNAVFGIINGSVYSATTGHFLERDYTGLNTSVTCGKSRNYRTSNVSNVMGASDVSAFPDKVTNSLNLATIMVQESAVVMRGLMPGLYEPIGGISITNYYDQILGQGIFSGTTFLMIPAINTNNGGSGLISLTGTWY